VDGEGIGADDEEPHVMGDERPQQIDKVLIHRENRLATATALR
jgi:hypothetical protein